MATASAKFIDAPASDTSTRFHQAAGGGAALPLPSSGLDDSPVGSIWGRAT